MTFEERLKYLSAREEADPSAVEYAIAQEDDPEVGIYGNIVGQTPDAQLWRPEFWKLAWEDLRALQLPTAEETINRAITAQVSLLACLLFILLLNDVVEAGLLQFGLSKVRNYPEFHDGLMSLLPSFLRYK